MTKKLIVAAALATALAASSAHAGGLIADIFVKPFNPQAAKILDDAHHGIKMRNPGYGKFEERTTNQVRTGLGLQPHCQPLFNKYGEQVGKQC